ncbi:MAG: hypothetical protein EOP40_10690 [Rubrivivax sp.]|nr:MAG: hypothetical protein EOP40_10690 [Rubrivivax sp.]
MTTAIHTIFTRRLAIGAALALGLACQAEAARYKVQLLDKGPYESVTVRDLNNAGQMVGVAYMPNGAASAVRWNGTAITTLDATGFIGSGARAINNHGAVVGSVEDGRNLPVAAAWSAAGQLTTMGRQYWYTTALAINDAGQIAGYANIAATPYQTRVVRWSGPDQALEDLFGGVGTEGYAIDGAGRVGGIQYDSSSQGGRYASTWSGGVQTLLPGTDSSNATITAMNEAGVAVGDAPTLIPVEGTRLRAVKWTGNGVPAILPAANAIDSRAVDVNKPGQVLGTITSKNIWGVTKLRPVIWSGTKVIDLSASLDFWYLISGWTVVNVVSLNDAGEVAVHLRKGADGELRAALLTPVP